MIINDPMNHAWYVHRDATGKAVAMCPIPQEGREPELGRIVEVGNNKIRWEFPNFRQDAHKAGK